MNFTFLNSTSLVSLVLFSIVWACKQDQFLSSHDKDALFAAPSDAEIETVFQDWAQRDLHPGQYRVIERHQLFDGAFELKLVSYMVSDIQEFGALLIPKTDKPLPVRMLLGGFGLGQTTNSVILELDSASAISSFILAMPAFRGQALEITFNSKIYKTPLSGGIQCEAFDGATDDAIAFLNAIQQNEQNADVTRTSMRGGSRGGGVALLAGIRDKRVKKVVDVVGPTDLLELTSSHTNDPTYQCQFLNSFKNKQSSLAETRKKLIASSPIYFAKHLPATQLHMGEKDEIVPVSQGYKLKQKTDLLGMSTNIQLFTYERAHSDIATNNSELASRIEQFLSTL